MELNLTYKSTQYAQQKSFLQTRFNDNSQTEKTTTDFQFTKLSSFRLSVQVMSKSEVNEQSVTLDFSILDISQDSPPQNSIALPQTDAPSPGLFNENGYWGVKQTSDRMANFVMNGAGDNLNRLRMGREGVIQGFKEAEQIWGGKLPEISYKTFEQALAKIDERIHSFGESVIDIAA